MHHDVITFLVLELVDDRDFLVSLFLRTDFGMVHDDFCMEYFLVYLFAKIVRYGSDKRALGQVGNLGCRNERIKLRTDGSGYILAVDGDGLPLLEHLAEAFGECLCRFPDYLPAKDIAHCILDNFRLFFTVIPVQLAEILKAETDRHLVASGGRYEVVQATEIDGGQLVDDDGALELPFLVDELYNA